MKNNLDYITMMDYLSQIVFKLFEDLNADQNDPKRFKLEICVSPG